MDKPHIMEELSMNYLATVAAANGISLSREHHDEDSTDCILKNDIRRSDGELYNVTLRVQLKSAYSTSSYNETEENIMYKLKVKNYNDLCRRGTSPIMLCLLLLPEDMDVWTKWSLEDLRINGRMYWASFIGQPESKNSNSINVCLEKSHFVSPQTLQDIFVKLAEEEEL